MTTKRAFVLLSGGIDSTTALHLTIETYGADGVEALSIDYGQRHARERQYAERTCITLGVPMTRINVPPELLGGRGVMLTDASVAIPDMSYADIRGVSPTYVPFRNGTMLSLAAAHAQKWVRHEAGRGGDNAGGAEAVIYIGAHAEDAQNWAYPDCTPEFVGAMACAIYVGTYRAVRLVAPFMHASKHEIIEVGQRLGVRWRDTWSCYAGEELHCGTCPTCRARRDAFARAGVSDPTVYDAARMIADAG